jgi:hypothetical protein
MWKRIRKFFNGENKMSDPKIAAPKFGIDLGTALLRPGASARNAEPIPLPTPVAAVNPTPVVSETASVKSEPAPQTPHCSKHAAPLVCRSCFEEERESVAAVQESSAPPIGDLDTDYLSVDKPPRSPRMIAALIASGETVEQRTLRLHNDIARFRRQRGS